MSREATYTLTMTVKSRGEDELPSPAELVFGIADGLHPDWFKDSFPDHGWWIDRQSITGGFTREP